MTTSEPRPGTTGEPSSAGPPRPGASGPSSADAPRSSTAPDGSAGRTADRSSKPGRARHPGKTIGVTLALALLVFVTVLLVLFVVFNTQTVQISLVFTDVQAPLVVALLVAAGLGGLVVGLASLLQRARRSR